MYKGIYIAASGAVLKQTQLEVLSQNLANANTIGYKKDGISFKQYLLPDEATGGMPDGRSMTSFSENKTDFTNGVINKTANQLDIALEGNGFIVLEGNKYTRRGDLKRSTDGYLTSFNGTKILGKKGPIKVPDGKLLIDNKGEISINNEIIDTIKIVDFKKKKELAKAGDGIFMTNEKTIPADASVRQGFIESSNVEPVREMVRMIETLRDFQTYQKAIQTFDETTAVVITQIGRL
ncbi:MAG: flagellar hook basal-body protein [Nitrospirota bacterium]